MLKVCVPGGQVPLRTLLLTSRYLCEQRKRGFGAWRTLRLCRSKRRHIASDRQLTSIERQIGAAADPTPSARSVFGDKSLASATCSSNPYATVLEPSQTHDELDQIPICPGARGPRLHRVDESLHCIRRGSGKPR